MKTIRDYPSIIFNAVVGRPFDFLWRFIKVEKRATIRSNVPLQVQADGDIVGTTPIDIEVVPGAVTVLVPEEAETAPEGDPKDARERTTHPSPGRDPELGERLHPRSRHASDGT
ncbi:MAG: hypothetical protein P8181_07140, partial [bacterium]